MILATRLLPPGVSAMALGPIILIRPERRYDRALIAHEKCHQRQQRKLLWLPWFILYAFSLEFRMQQEIEAYKEQIALGLPLWDAARYLATLYGLKITEQEAAFMLSQR